MILLKWSSDTVSLQPPIPRGLSSPPKKKPEALRMAYGAVHDLLFPGPPSSTLQSQLLLFFIHLFPWPRWPPRCSSNRSNMLLPQGLCTGCYVCSVGSSSSSLDVSFPHGFTLLLSYHLATRAFPNNTVSSGNTFP